MNLKGKRAQGKVCSAESMPNQPDKNRTAERRCERERETNFYKRPEWDGVSFFLQESDGDDVCWSTDRSNVTAEAGADKKPERQQIFRADVNAQLIGYRYHQHNVRNIIEECGNGNRKNNDKHVIEQYVWA